MFTNYVLDQIFIQLAIIDIFHAHTKDEYLIYIIRYNTWKATKHVLHQLMENSGCINSIINHNDQPIQSLITTTNNLKIGKIGYKTPQTLEAEKYDKQHVELCS